MEKIFGAFEPSAELRAQPGEWLTEDEMRASLPSIFAEDKHDSRSDRYTYVSTIDLLRALAAEGFRPTYATQQRTRREGMKGHTKHLLRLRSDFSLAKPDVGEIGLLNSHGGQSRVQLFAGWWRFLCLNGHFVGDMLANVKVAHKGNIVEDVVNGAISVAAGLNEVGDHVEAWKGLSLSREEQRLLAQGAATVRFDLNPGEQSPVPINQILQPRRQVDRREDLWTVYNNVQENLNKGGLFGLIRDKNNHLRQTTTRPIKGIDQNVALNRALWTLAEGMADLKKGNAPTLPPIRDAEFREVN